MKMKNVREIFDFLFWRTSEKFHNMSQWTGNGKCLISYSKIFVLAHDVCVIIGYLPFFKNIMKFSALNLWPFNWNFHLRSQKRIHHLNLRKLNIHYYYVGKCFFKYFVKLQLISSLIISRKSLLLVYLRRFKNKFTRILFLFLWYLEEND